MEEVHGDAAQFGLEMVARLHFSLRLTVTGEYERFGGFVQFDPNGGG
jgi:hypothetical protein